MQTTKQFQTDGVNVTKLHVSGYQLTTALLRGGIASLELNNTASLVLLYLASCYNGGAIFPRISTIAANVGISEISVKRGIAELLNKQCLMKSKRHNGTNANCYVLTQKILSMYQNGTNKGITMIPTCMKLNHEKLEKQQQVVVSFENKVKGAEEETSREASSTAVSVSSETQSKFNLDEIPEIILKNKKIRNVKRYWCSLRPAIKLEYLHEQEKKDRLKKEREELERQEAERKAKEKAEQEAYEKLPLNERWSYQQAVKHVWSMRWILNRRGHHAIGLTADLIELYNLDVKQVCQMTQEQINEMCLC